MKSCMLPSLIHHFGIQVLASDQESQKDMTTLLQSLKGTLTKQNLHEWPVKMVLSCLQALLAFAHYRHDMV